MNFAVLLELVEVCEELGAGLAIMNMGLFDVFMDSFTAPKFNRNKLEYDERFMNKLTC